MEKSDSLNVLLKVLSITFKGIEMQSNSKI